MRDEELRFMSVTLTVIVLSLIYSFIFMGMNAEAKTITKHNSCDVVAQINKVKKMKNGKHKIIFTCYGDVKKYDGMEYECVLTKKEWKEESFKKNQKVMVWFYDNGTKEDVTDDIIINISHKRYKKLSRKA